MSSMHSFGFFWHHYGASDQWLHDGQHTFFLPPCIFVFYPSHIAFYPCLSFGRAQMVHRPLKTSERTARAKVAFEGHETGARCSRRIVLERSSQAAC
ncbi:hypothetical protein IQ06DRAFT_129533 [Phaeosphaeriaceae sp. SRC1lsM3a]|nr:hypothetical protein IQ06DRAFT_129533 [Stagonospora sp. SRC1lsM3a]